jgi:hypothetical protein
LTNFCNALLPSAHFFPEDKVMTYFHCLQGLSTVLETGIGAPDPEELAVLEKQEELKLLEEKKQNEANEREFVLIAL